MHPSIPAKPCAFCKKPVIHLTAYKCEHPKCGKYICGNHLQWTWDVDKKIRCPDCFKAIKPNKSKDE